LNTDFRSKKKVVIRVACALAVLWLIACGALYGVMRQSPEKFARVMARIPGPIPFLVLPFETLWLRARAGTLQIGGPAPDFTLAKLDKSEPIQLSSLAAQGHPVAVVFGSYT